MKNKLNRNLLVVITAFGLFLSSCSGFLESEQKEETISTVRISLAQDVRTALPSIKNESDFKKIKLEYQKLDENELPVGAPEEKSWETDSTDTDKTAALQMSGASIRVEPGFKYSFTLYAYFNANETESYYSGTCKQNMSAGENIITFTLTLEKLAPESGKGSLSLTVQNTGSLKKIVLSLSKKSDSDYAPYGDAKTFELAAGENTKTVDYPDVDAGYYKALLEFYDSNGVKIGYNVQYATIVNGITSKNIEEIDAAASKNQLYSITYDFETTSENGSETIGGGSFADNSTAPGQYSRFSNIKFSNATKDDYVFLGWYIKDAEGNLGEQIKKIEAGTRTGDITLAPKFFAKKELPELTTVTLSDNSGENPRYRDTLTAVLKASDGSDFTGTVSYQWYRGNNPIEGEKNARYQLTVDDIAKEISVKVTQKYTVTEDSENSLLYSVAQDLRSPVSSSAVTVSKGKLSGSYEKKYSDLKLIGSPLSAIAAESDDSDIKNQVNEVVPVTIRFEEGAVAPNASGWLTMIASAANYDSLTLENAGFVNVKANPISKNDANAVLSTDITNIPIGHVKFVSEITGKQYAITTSEPDGNTEWTSTFAETPFAEPAGRLYVRKAKVGTLNEAGYIAESEPTQVLITDSNRGTLITIKDSSIRKTSNTQSDELRFGDTVTADLTFNGYTWDGAHPYLASKVGTVAYQWYKGSGTELEPISGAVGTYLGSPVDYKITDSSAVGKKITIKFSHTQVNNQGNYSQKSTSAEVQKGELTWTGTLTYAPVAVVGSTLDNLSLTGVTFENQAKDSVSPELAFVNSTAPDEHKSVKVKASKEGYKDIELSVQVYVKAVVPELSGNLSTEVENIPYGYIKFTQAAVDKQLQYSTVSTEPQNDEDWTDVTSTFEIPAPEHLYLRIAQTTNVNASDSSEDLASGLTSYLGNRYIKIDSVTFNNPDITLTASGKTLTATVPDDASEVAWSIYDENLDSIATVNGNSLTFKDNVQEGTYFVTVKATRGENVLSATYSIQIGNN